MTTYFEVPRIVTKAIKIYHKSRTSNSKPCLEFKGKKIPPGTTFLTGQPETIVHKNESMEIVPIVQRKGKRQVIVGTGEFLLLTELLESQP